MKTKSSALIDPETLKQWLSTQDVVVLFTKMTNPVNPAEKLIVDDYIPGALLFDFEDQFCDKTSSQPHTLPQASEFAKQAGKLGITNDSVVVIYDAQAMFCAPRVWWMFKVMGHQNVFVLNGGLLSWIESGFETQNFLNEQKISCEYTAKFQQELYVSKQQVFEQIEQLDSIVVDARSLPRFYGEVPEPRPGVRSGHIPNAKCLPFNRLIENNQIKPVGQLKRQFKELNLLSNKRLIFSCGSGVTASILALSAEEIGVNNWAVYDGSWTEWGSDNSLPLSYKK